jgi:hypothetical protein
MKLLLENWRRQCGEYDFDILCENFDRGLITEIELYETWDRQVMVEMQTLLDEGIMDIFKIGYEKGKVLVGKAKKTYDAAIAKVTEFYLKLCLQAWGLIQKGKVVLERIAAILMKGVNFIKKFCNEHPILCKVIFALVVLFCITAVMAMMATPAMAKITTGSEGEYVISDTGVLAIKGCLEHLGRHADPEGQQLTVDALEWLDKAHTATTSTNIHSVADEGARVAQICYETMVQEAPAEEIRHLARLGKKVMVAANEYDAKLNAVEIRSIKWQSLSLSTDAENVSRLHPKNFDFKK